jgi:hypothetical protein
MSVQVIRSGTLDQENGARVPVLGHELSLRNELARTTTRLEKLEANLQQMAASSTKVESFHTKIRRIIEAVSALEDRISDVEDPATIDALIRRIEALTGRLDEVDCEEGRLDRLELEMEDLVGPDGDVVDLNDRMDRVEGRAPDLISAIKERERNAPQQRRIEEVLGVVDKVRARTSSLEFNLVAMEDALEKGGAGTTTPEEIGAIRRGGDVMTGGLTINRGGLQVLSGGVICRGASVTSLDVSNLLKAPKAIVDTIELRGDLTVDSAKRLVQVRYVEGRQGSARRDGALHLNGRSGGEVVVGTESSARGMQVHGTVSTDRVDSAGGNSLAQIFSSSGDLQAADVVRVNDDGTKVQRVRKAADTRVIGVVTDCPGVLLGGPRRSGTVAVALQGAVPCRVEADAHPIQAGDLLMACRTVGHARRVDPDAPPPPGALLGKALAPLAKGQGIILVLLGRG